MIKHYNVMTATDSYKVSHFEMLEDIERLYSYFSARVGAKYDHTVLFGLQYKLKEYFVGQQVTREKINFAENLLTRHMGVFNRPGWEYILNKYNGKLPLSIKAIPEGTPVNDDNVLMTVDSTDKNVAWLSNYVEPSLSHVWAPSTAASMSYAMKKEIKNMLRITSDATEAELDSIVEFMFHDFGFRGSSGYESSACIGAGHLLSFLGTDTVPAMEMLHYYYNANLTSDFNLGFSIPASEHCVMTQRGREGEFEVVEYLLNKYPTGPLAMVIDSYDYVNFIIEVAKRFKDRILNRDGFIVFRPDSGEPKKISIDVFNLLAGHFGHTINNKGYVVLPPQVRALWGDGINDVTGIEFYNNLIDNKISVENFALGCGGGIHTNNTRDTQKFAYKASYLERQGKGMDIFKDPITEPFKKSKRGRLAVVKDGNGFKTVNADDVMACDDQLVEVFRNGELLVDYTLDDLRNNIRC